jgi:4-amino-4-deoxy-L-arabinose transferase-like glycosyltransferase
MDGESDGLPDPATARPQSGSFVRAMERPGSESFLGAWLLAGLLCAANLAVGTFDHGVWAPTEPAVAGVTEEMRFTGDVAVPRIDGLASLEKPPWTYALAFLVGRVAGTDAPWTLRLPAVIAGTASVLLLAWIVRRRHGQGVAAATALFLASAYPIWEVTHRASTDAQALCFSALCFALFLRSLEAEREGPWIDVPLAIALALSFYAKNFYVWLIVLPSIVVFLALERCGARLVRLGLAFAVASAAVLTPWALALHHQGGLDYLRVAFFDNGLGRFFDLESSGMRPILRLNDALRAEKNGSPLFYVLPALALFAPWTPLVLTAVADLFRRPADRQARFVRCTILVVPSVLTLSSSKVNEYILPLAIPLAFALGEGIAQVRSSGALVSGWSRRLVVVNIAIAALLALCAPFLVAVRLAAPLALVALLPLAAGGWFAWRRRHLPIDALACGIAPASIGFALLVCGSVVVPALDREKSEAEFFARIRPSIDGCALVTTICDDRRLPMLTYYLGRRIEIVSSLEGLRERLRRPGKVAALVSYKDWLLQRRHFADLPIDVIEPSGGRQLFACLVRLREG